jgi:hypothetical protein
MLTGVRGALQAAVVVGLFTVQAFPHHCEYHSICADRQEVTCQEVLLCIARRRNYFVSDGPSAVSTVGGTCWHGGFTRESDVVMNRR